MANQAGPVCRLCRREGIKLFLKGEQVHDQVHLRQAQRAAPRAARPGAAPQDQRLRHPAARQAAGAPSVRRARGPVPHLLRPRRAQHRGHRHGAAAAAGAAPRQRRLPARPRRVAARGAPAGVAPPLHRSTARSSTSPPPRSGPATWSRCASAAASCRRSATPASWWRAAPSRTGSPSTTAALKGTVVRLPERHEMEQTIDEQLVVEFYVDESRIHSRSDGSRRPQCMALRTRDASTLVRHPPYG